MKKIFWQSKVFWSVLLWVITGVVLGGSWVGDISLPATEWRLLLPLVLFIKELLTYGVKIKPLGKHIWQWEKIEQDIAQGNIPSRYRVALANRVYIFPVVLGVYLVYLLIQQTGIWGLEYSILFLSLNEYLLLTVTIVSGIGVLFGDQHDICYSAVRGSIQYAYFHLGLSMVLSIFGGYIILQQVLSLGILGIGIANISGLLVFLIGVLLMRGDE